MIKYWLSLNPDICKFNIALLLRAILLLSPVMLLFYNENGLNAKDLFFFQGVFYLVSVIVEIPVGYLSDRKSRRNLLVFSFAIFLGIVLLWLFFKGYYIILAGEILFAISKVIMDNAMSGYLYDYLNNKNMVKYYGYLNFYLALGTTVAALLGTYLFTKFGSHFVLVCEMILILTSIILMASIPNIRIKKDHTISLKKKLEDFSNNIKDVSERKEIKYHMLYSGFLTAFSILFAVSFQPLMQHAYFPIILFGAIAFINHLTRSIAGIVCGKWLRNVNIRNFIIPLFVLYIFGFTCLFAITEIKSIIINFTLLVIICLIICVQLIFTILHVSRIHSFVSIEKRGGLMSINNLISRGIAAVILLSSKIFITKVGLTTFFGSALIIFLIFGSYMMVKTYQIKE